MILGLGTDVVEVERIRTSLARFGPRFLDRIFTPAEQTYCRGKRHPEESLAARFAAKEAGAKALGTGMARGVGWHDFEVVRKPGCAPTMLLHGRARARAAELGVQGMHVSLSHTAQYASAVVLFEADVVSQASPAERVG